MSEIRGFDLKVFGPFCAIWEPFLTAFDASKTESDAKASTSPKVHDTTSAVLKSAVRVDLELMALASRRVQAYIHYPVELMTSRNPQDMLERMTAFYQIAFEQYSTSSNKVISIWGDAAQVMCGEVNKVRDYIDFTQVPRAESLRSEAEERPRHRRAA